MPELTEATSIDIVAHLEWLRSAYPSSVAPITRRDRDRFTALMGRESNRALDRRALLFDISTALARQKEELIRHPNLKNEAVWRRYQHRSMIWRQQFGDRYFQFPRDAQFSPHFRRFALPALLEEKGFTYNPQTLLIYSMGEWMGGDCVESFLELAAHALDVPDANCSVIPELSLTKENDPLYRE